MRHDATAILVAAGSGRRLGGGVPKALVELHGRPLARHAADALCRIGGVGRLIVVVPEGSSEAPFREAMAGARLPLDFVTGGARRRDSVRSGLDAARSPLVLVHDAARPFATVALGTRVIDAARRDGAAVPAVPVPDTLARDAGGRIGEIVPRAGVVAIQTPQGFSLELLRGAHDAAPADWDAPDDGAMMERAGYPVSLVPGDPENVKITWPEDLARARDRMSRRDGGVTMRIGLGWDVHPLVKGRRFVLAGIVLDETFGPAGHSDGDPLCHAIADALLGAAGLGDIGTLYPDDDPACEGIPGRRLLAGAVARIAETGWEPLHVDAVVITDRPKIAPARESVRAALAEDLGIDPAEVSVKGKRTEGLGGLAAGAGVGCRAIAQVVRRSS